MSTERLRFGVLGAARIAPEVLVRPAALRADVDVIAIAARNEARARAFAVEHGIPTAYGSYEALLADPRIDAVYIALPTALHARYSITALAAGKHVLCEKPFAANALEAEAMVAAAASSGKVLAEAFHYYYHPFADEMRTLGSTHLTSRPVHVTASFFVPVDRPDDFRRNFELGGGAFLDLRLLSHPLGTDAARRGANRGVRRGRRERRHRRSDVGAPGISERSNRRGRMLDGAVMQIREQHSRHSR